PSGSTIVGDDDSKIVFVNWGDTGGKIEASISSTCGSSSLFLDVLVEPPLVQERVLENFDDEALVEFDRSDGIYQPDVDNPSPAGINASALVGRYSRNSGSTFDVLRYNVQRTTMGNATLFENGTKRFYLDLYTDAPIGTKIILQLENSSFSIPTNYPTGRHSRYEAVTTLQNDWERLEFAYLDSPDPGVSDIAIDWIVLLFAPDTQSGNVYHIDNLDIYAPGSTVSSTNLETAAPKAFSINPTPANNTIVVENLTNRTFEGYRLMDLQGREVLREPLSFGPFQSRTIDVHHLPSGTFLLMPLHDSTYHKSIHKVIISR
nr:T9SS type A sorting domain-containing protein [Saprospiraceae bacterium]